MFLGIFDNFHTFNQIVQLKLKLFILYELLEIIQYVLLAQVILEEDSHWNAIFNLRSSSSLNTFYLFNWCSQYVSYSWCTHLAAVPANSGQLSLQFPSGLPPRTLSGPAAEKQRCMVPVQTFMHDKWACPCTYMILLQPRAQQPQREEGM